MRVVAAAEVGERELESLLAAREMIVVIGEGELRGLAAAALLFADYAVLRDGATLHLDDPRVWAGVVWRLGRGAMTLLLDTAGSGGPQQSGRFFTTHEAIEAGLADATDFDPANRSTIALDVTATLLRGRGGDPLERATFAWIFATGEPAEGLSAFLEKRRPAFRNEGHPH